jgi:hypothetical protein
MRRLWPAGRALLTGSAALYLALLVAHLLRAGGPLTAVVNEAVLISALLNLAIIAYLWRSELVRDLFQEFPAR